MYHLSLIEPESLNNQIEAPCKRDDFDISKHVKKPSQSNFLSAYNLKSEGFLKTSLIHVIKRTLIGEALNKLYCLSTTEIERLELEKEYTSVINYFVGSVSLYAYKIELHFLKAIDINEKLGLKSPNPDRNEIAVYDSFNKRNIVYFRKITMYFPSGRIQVGDRESIENINNTGKNIIYSNVEDNSEKQLLNFKKEIKNYSNKKEFQSSDFEKWSLQTIIFKSLFRDSKGLSNKTKIGTKIRELLNKSEYNILKDIVIEKNKGDLKYRHMRVYALGLKQQYNNNAYGTEEFFTNKFKQKTISKGKEFISNKEEIISLVNARNPTKIEHVTTNLESKFIITKKGVNRNIYILKTEKMGYKIYYNENAIRNMKKKNATLNLDLRLNDIYSSEQFYNGKYSYLNANESLFIDGQFVSVFYLIENAIPLGIKDSIPLSTINMMIDAGFSAIDIKPVNFVKVPNEDGGYDFLPIDAKYIANTRCRSNSVRDQEARVMLDNEMLFDNKLLYEAMIDGLVTGGVLDGDS
ncbi:hypothetical protein [uncultured Shewanella sp.]|uniref:hypothetical protein n=1 Tax=uncultured Shewanella sp. TaxID=173975 RepID=UPI002626F057|nr:hypothetical protein [uncultured Shewanella sp.]